MRTSVVTFAVALALSGCSAPKSADTASPVDATHSAMAPAATASDATSAPAVDANVATDSTAGDAHATSGTGKPVDSNAAGDMKGMDMSGNKATDAMASSAQAGWYTAGSFRPCGSGKGMKVDKAADIEKQIKASGMSASDPVYLKLEGMAMGDSYMLTKVAQVGSKAPVRDCPMTGAKTQVGG